MNAILIQAIGFVGMGLFILSQLIGAPCTLLYDALIRSWGGALNEGIAILSILISIYRFGWKALEEENS